MKSNQKVFCESKQGILMPQKKNFGVLPYRNVNMAVQFTDRQYKWQHQKSVKSSTIQRRDFIASDGWTIRIMIHNGLAVHHRTTLLWQLLTEYLEKWKTLEHYIINMCQKHE